MSVALERNYAVLAVAVGLAVSACSPGDRDFSSGGSGGAGGSGASASAGGASGGAGGDPGCQGAACACGDGLTRCDDACVDLQSTATDCGRCGHSCAQGACAAGACQPWTVAPFADVHQMDADASYVVWSDSSTGVHQIKVADGTVINVVQSSSLQPRSGPVLRGGTLAFVGRGGSLYTAREGDATATEIASISSGYTPTYLAVNPSATTAFLLGQDTSAPYEVHLLQCPLAGGGCGPLGGAIESPGTPGYQTGDLMVTDDHALWTYRAPSTGTSSINSYTFATNAVSTLVTTFNGSLAVDANNVYFSGTPLYTIYALPLSFTSATVPQKVANSAERVSSLASDGVNVYFGTSKLNGPGRLYSVPVGGGTPALMYTSPHTSGSDVSAVAVAGGVVTWADGDFSTDPETFSIMAIAAP